jgi:hypothetical protein
VSPGTLGADAFATSIFIRFSIVAALALVI